MIFGMGFVSRYGYDFRDLESDSIFLTRVGYDFCDVFVIGVKYNFHDQSGMIFISGYKNDFREVVMTRVDYHIHVRK